MIYFDNAATTKPSSLALAKAQIFNEEKYFNPSALYSGGLTSSKAIIWLFFARLNVVCLLLQRVNIRLFIRAF